MSYLILKRILDLIISTIALLLLSPLLLVLTILGALMFSFNPFFFQQRIGLDEKAFVLLKFRSMDGKNITPYGAVLRKFSLDELPQLLLVFNGTMSLVGPRPLLPAYLDLYSDLHKTRHLVKPGITGLAQVNGRNETSWDQRLDFDARYASEMSFDMDALIFFKTFWVWIAGKGSSSQTSDLMRPFTGY